MKPHRLPKSIRKFIRREKARIRKAGEHSSEAGRARGFAEAILKQYGRSL